MSFDATWLDLREPADHAARDTALLIAARAYLGPGLGVDLGCGTGSTVRAFGGGRWRLVDLDPDLLAFAAKRCPGAEMVTADLGDVDGLPVADARLVTASALFDLVSRDWLEAFADRMAEGRLGVYAALSYDGVMTWVPARPDDAAVTAAFNAHQGGDKGFGPALGPAAGPALAEAFGARGYVVRMAESPWRLGPGQRALAEALVEGIADAAGAPAWGQARRAASAVSACSIGHWDVLALPGAPSAQSKITSVSRP